MKHKTVEKEVNNIDYESIVASGRWSTKKAIEWSGVEMDDEW
jgi:hypothetical protein